MPLKKPDFQLFLLGPPRIESGGKPERLDTRKALALIAYLALHDDDFQRDALTALLWPELDQSRARAALRRTLTPLNNALGKGALITTRETVMLNPDFSLWVDQRAFEQHIGATRTHGHLNSEVCKRCVDPLEQALVLYRGGFMEGFSLRDSAAFDDWQFSESQRLHRLCTEIQEKLTVLYERENHLEKAIEHAYQWLAMDQLHEPAHRALMRLYIRTGQRSNALRQYRECLRILDRELGVSPLEETTRLYEDILENRFGSSERVNPVEVVRPSLNAAAMLDNPAPMVGRSDSWISLQSAFQLAKKRGQLVVIEGELGIGKTRLAQEFVDYAQSTGATVFSSRCYEGEKILAYSPVYTALRSTVDQKKISKLTQSLAPIWRYEAARLLPELVRTDDSLQDFGQADPLSAQSRLYESVRQILTLLSESGPPGVLFIDDLQWADSASIDLLAYLVRRLAQLTLIIIVTWRSDYVDPHDPLRNLYAEASRGGVGTLIQLERLNESEVAEIAEHFSKVPDAVKKNLFANTEGLPFFVIEYLSAAFTLTDRQIPEGIRDIQQARLANLDEASRQLLTTAAVIGRSFDFETLRFASGRSEEETIGALEKLLNKGLLAEKNRDEPAAVPNSLTRLPQYDFSHETLHQIVLNQTSLARQRLLHSRVAGAYQKQSQRSDENAARIGHHLSQSGQDERAAEYFYKAGEHARNLYANGEALAHFESALALGYPDAASIHEAIGDLLTLGGEYKRAVLSFEKSASLADASLLPQIERKLANVHHRRGDYDLAASHFKTALELFEENEKDTGIRAMIHIDWSRNASMTGDITLGRKLAETGLELAETGKDRYMISLAHNVLGILARKSGQLNDARAHLESALASADDFLPARIAALNNLALVSSEEGHFQEAIDLTRSALEACTKLGDRHREAALRNHLSDRLHAHGRSDKAMLELKKAVEIFAEIGKEMGDLQPEIWKLVEW